MVGNLDAKQQELDGREISRGSIPEPRDLGLPSPHKTAHPYHPIVKRMFNPSLEGLIAAAASGNMISASIRQPLA